MQKLQLMCLSNKTVVTDIIITTLDTIVLYLIIKSALSILRCMPAILPSRAMLTSTLSSVYLRSSRGRTG